MSRTDLPDAIAINSAVASENILDDFETETENEASESENEEDADLESKEPDIGAKSPLRGLIIDDKGKSMKITVGHYKKSISFSNKLTRTEAWTTAVEEWKILRPTKHKDHNGKFLIRGIKWNKEAYWYNGPKKKCISFSVKEYKTLDKALKAVLLAFSEANQKKIKYSQVKSRLDHRNQSLPLNLYYKKDKGYEIRYKTKGIKNKQFFPLETGQTLDETLERSLKVLEKFHGGAIKYSLPKSKKNKRPQRKDPLGNILPKNLQFQHIAYVIQSQKHKLLIRFPFGPRCKCKTMREASDAALSAYEKVKDRFKEKSNFEFLGPEEKNRVTSVSLERRFQFYKASAKTRNLSFDLTFEEFAVIVQNPCHHCGKSAEDSRIGVDRKLGLLGYSTLNALPSCTFDNRARSVNEILVFYGHVKLIVETCLGWSVTLPPWYSYKETEEVLSARTNIKSLINKEDAELRALNNRDEIEKLFNHATRAAKAAAHEFKITLQEYCVAIQQNCAYCGRTPKEVNIGLDRIKSSMDYLLHNIAPACKNCNGLKGMEQFENVLQQLERILLHQGFTLTGTRTVKENQPLSELMKTDVSKYLRVLTRSRKRKRNS